MTEKPKLAEIVAKLMRMQTAKTELARAQREFDEACGPNGPPFDDRRL